MKKRSANDFLANMNMRDTEDPKQKGTEQPNERSKTAARTGLKHIGGYLDSATVEKIAILRARLNLDNSKLIKLAIEDLFKKQETRKAFAE